MGIAFSTRDQPRAGGCKTAQLLGKKTVFMGKIQAAGACSAPRQGVWEQSQFKGRGEMGFAQKGAHIQLQKPLEILTGGISQLLSSREGAAAHRSSSSRKGRL